MEKDVPFDIKELQLSNTNLQAIVDKAVSSNNQLQDQVQQCSQDKAALEARLRVLENNVKELERGIKELTTQNRALTTEAQKNEQNNADLTARVKEMEATVKQVGEEREALNSTFQQYRESDAHLLEMLKKAADKKGAQMHKSDLEMYR